jgi:oxygen-independent coproporphyrinogen-3 oxidase
MERALSWKDIGVNRLSIGVQSFYEEDLRWMNRAHSARQSLESIKMVKELGFDNISIDLIYGSPGLTDNKWKENMQQALDLAVPHLSCYALTVEQGTALHHMIRKKASAPVHSEDQARQFMMLMEHMDLAGYEHYEISNFSKPGMYSRHNSAYWSGDHYLGLGPSAHSYNGETRQWNIANNARYIDALRNGILPMELERLSHSDQHNEFIMIALRQKQGLNIREFNSRFGNADLDILKDNIGKYVKIGKIIEENGAFRLTREGKLFADGIAADLFK